jgi:hypothetical protein
LSDDFHLQFVRRVRELIWVNDIFEFFNSRITGSSALSFSKQFNRNKKQKVYSDDDDEESDGSQESRRDSRQFSSLPVKSLAERDGYNSDDERGGHRDLTVEELTQVSFSAPF